MHGIAGRYPRRPLPLLLAVVILVGTAAVGIVPSAGAVPAPEATYRITLENHSSQVFSPPVIVAHDPDVHLFERGGYASEELRILAEDGNNAPLAALAEEHAASTVEALADPVPPGESVTVEISAPKLNSRISVATMLVQTNDGFTGVDSAMMPSLLGGYALHLNTYDAGTEMNNELADYVPGPPFGGMMRDPEDRSISMHPGIQGIGDIDPAEWDWHGPVARLSIERAETPVNPGSTGNTATYQVTIDNHTSAQPFSAPLLAVHDWEMDLFEPGHPATSGIQAIAEDGNNMPLAESLDQHGVYWVEALGEAVPPGESVTIQFEAPKLGVRFSSAMMLVNSNDGFTGADSVMLPRLLGVTDVHANTYDAGTEMNNELADYMPGQGGTMRVPEDGVIHHHPGILGHGDLDPAVYDWDDPVARILIERIEPQELMPEE